jgi:hypothetical protein
MPSFFVGREAELKDLAKVLKEGTVSVVAATTGIGGVGKTQLAAEFVHRYGQYFEGGVFWLDFSEPESIATEVALCGGSEGLNLAHDFSNLSIKDQVFRVRAEWDKDIPRLLIFDNCEDLDLITKWRPKTGASRVLVTSRQGKLPKSTGIQHVPLGVLPREESIALLLTLLVKETFWMQSPSK